MKSRIREFELPTLDSIMHVALASVLVAFALVTAFPLVQALIV